MNMRTRFKTSLFCAGLLMLGGAAPDSFAKEGKAMSVEKSDLSKLFSCAPPQGWLAKPSSDGGVRYSDGRRSISVVRHGVAGSPYKTPQEFLKFLSSMKTPEPSQAVEIAGRRADRFIRNYEFSVGGDDGMDRKEWIYEEIVLIKKVREGFWVLRFQSPSLMYTEKPKGLDLWKAFLKGFKLNEGRPGGLRLPSE
ncbi:MAG: hypothetical protein WCU88_03575 [Elusimicrobiota bacterium]|jgi:hypothetical protein